MTDDLAKTVRALRNIARDGGALEIADGLAQAWIDKSRQVVPVDTGQLKHRTTVVSVRGGRTSGEAEVQADTPYAGFVEYGTRYMAPRPFFRQGRDHAVAVANELGGRLENELRRSLESGGVWNPRRLF